MKVYVVMSWRGYIVPHSRIEGVYFRKASADKKAERVKEDRVSVLEFSLKGYRENV